MRIKEERKISRRQFLTVLVLFIEYLLATEFLLWVWLKDLLPIPEPPEPPKTPAELLQIFSQLVSEAVEFKPVIGADDEINYFEAYDEMGMLIAYVFVAEGRGFEDFIIEMAGAVDLDYRVIAIEVVRQSETPGRGDRITEPWFKDQFTGLSVEEVRLSPHDGEIDAITGATISSQAVVDAIRNKMEEVIELTS